MTVYDLYIFPRMSVPAGSIELRISTDVDSFAMVDAAGDPLPGKTVLRISEPTGTWLLASEYTQRPEDESGDLVDDPVDIEFLDMLSITGELFTGGVSDGTITQDFGAEATTFLDNLFADDAATYHVYLALYRHDGDREIFFNGTTDAREGIERDHHHPHAPHTTSEQQIAQVVRISAEPLLGRVQAVTVKDLKDAVSAFVFTGGVQQVTPLTAAPAWYAGMICKRVPLDDGEVGEEEELIPEDWATNTAFLATFNYGAYEIGGNPDNVDYTELGYEIPSSFWPQSTWPITIKRLMEMVAISAGLWNPEDIPPGGIAADVARIEIEEPEFEYTANHYSGGVYVEDAPVAFEDIEVSYNHTLGIVGQSAGEIELPERYHKFPITWEETDSIATIIRDVCRQFGWVPEFSIEQESGTGALTLRLAKRRANRGGLPAEFSLVAGTSKETTRQIGKTFVSVKYRGDDVTYKCPATAAGDEGIDIELPFRTRAFGNTAAPVVPSDRLLLDKNKDLLGQAIFNQRIGPSEADLVNADSWVIGAHLFYHRSDTGNYAYPAGIPPVFTAGGDNWTGMYALRSCTEKPGEYANRDNALWAAAQFYARELVGDRIVIERTYRGILGDDGKLSSVRPGIEASWRARGSVRTFRAAEVRRDLLNNTTVITWIERPDDYDTLTDLPVEIIQGDAGGTSGGGGGTGTRGVSNVANTTVQGLAGVGTADYLAMFTTSATLKSSRARGNGVSGVIEVPGQLTDTTAALFGGSTATGYAQTGVAGASDTGSAVKGTSANGLAGEFVGKTKTTTLQITAGSPGVGKMLVGTDTAGNAAWSALATTIPVRAIATYDFIGNDGVGPHGLIAGQNDGVSISAGHWVLVLSESDQTYNDVYVAAAGAWTRAPIVLRAGSHVQVMPGGATGGGRIYYCSNTADPVRGADNITFSIAQAIPTAGSVGTAQLTNDAATNANLANMPALSVKARASNSAGDPGDLAAAVNDRVLARTSGALAFTQVNTGMLEAGAVTTAIISSDGASSAGQALTYNGTAVVWASPAITMPDPRGVGDEDATFAVDDGIVQWEEALTIPHVGNLPSAADPAVRGRLYIAKDASGTANGTNKISITPAFPSTIDGMATADITTAYGTVRFYSDGANWYTW